MENLLISTCLERGNRDGAIKNYLKDEPQKPSYSFNDVTYYYATEVWFISRRFSIEIMYGSSIQGLESSDVTSK
ncbi:MAG: hypothetical protein ACXWL9_09005, partial [Syntrophales bacterium]